MERREEGEEEEGLFDEGSRSGRGGGVGVESSEDEGDN